MNKEQMEELEDLLAGFLKAAREFKETGNGIVVSTRTINDDTTRTARNVVQSLNKVDEKVSKAIGNIDFRLKQLEQKENKNASTWGAVMSILEFVGMGMICGFAGGATIFAGLRYFGKI